MADQPARGVETAHAMAAETAPPSKYASAQQLLEFMDKNKATAKHVFGMMDADGDRGVTIDEIGQLLHNIGAAHEVGEYNEQTVYQLFACLTSMATAWSHSMSSFFACGRLIWRGG